MILRPLYLEESMLRLLTVIYEQTEVDIDYKWTFLGYSLE